MPKVKVDWTKCNGCGTCVDNCPALVFELQELPDYLKRRIQLNIEKEDLINYNNPDKNVIFVPVTGITLSSTRIRSKLRQGKSIKFLVPSDVEDFIEVNNLYKE